MLKLIYHYPIDNYALPCLDVPQKLHLATLKFVVLMGENKKEKKYKRMGIIDKRLNCL